jgi:hypothetical protein
MRKAFIPLAFLAALWPLDVALAGFDITTGSGTHINAVDSGNQGTSGCAAASTECPASVPIDTTGTAFGTASNPFGVKPADTTISTALTGTGTVSVATNGSATVNISASGSGTGLVFSFQGQMPDASWQTVNAYAIPAVGQNAAVTGGTANGEWQVLAAGYSNIRVNLTAISGGTETFGLRASAAVQQSQVDSAIGSGGTLNGFDFSLHNTHLSLTVSGWTISNSKFLCGPHNSATGGMISVGASVTSATFMYNSIDGGDTIGGTICDTTTLATMVDDRQVTGSFVWEYNLCHLFDAKCINFAGGAGGTLTITEKYNYYYEVGIAGSTHGESEYAYFGSNIYTVNWEVGYNVGINRFYVNPSNATAPLAQQADSYTLVTNLHHNFAIDRGNQSYTGSNNPNGNPNSAPIYLGQQTDPLAGAISGTSTANILEYSGGFFPYNKGSSFGSVAGNVTDYNAGTGNTCTVSGGGAITCN